MWEHMQSYRKNAKALPTSSRLANKVLLCIHSLYRSFDQIVTVNAAITGAFIKYTTLSPLVHELGKQTIFNKTCHPLFCNLNITSGKYGYSKISVTSEI